MERSIFIRNKISRKALEWGFFVEKKSCVFLEKSGHNIQDVV